MRFIDLLCGAGGLSTGFVEAGGELVLGINHWDVCLRTHAANHPTAEHLRADLTDFQMRYLPKADVLAAGVICTESSPAGGNAAPTNQLSLLDGDEEFQTLPPQAFERTRATAWTVVRAAEAQRFSAILVENVVEFTSRWLLFPDWIRTMATLGYKAHYTCVSSAHIGDDSNTPAPQWRDRVYILFLPKGARKPDLEPRPRAYCFECGRDVRARQSWRDPRVRIGKYKQQYDYRCPNTSCHRAIVEPYVRPAADIIDWSNIGGRIGDRKKPLADTTMRRIESGLRKFSYDPSCINVNHGAEGGDRAFDPSDRPLPTRATKQGEALLVPTGGSWNTEPTTVHDPMRTRTTRESEALVTVDPLIVEFRNHQTVAPASNPVTTIAANGNHHGLLTGPDFTRGSAKTQHRLVIPYRKAATRTTADPLLTMATRDSAALVSTAVNADDCYFRMLQAREQLLAQRFPPEYIVHGTQAEQTVQAGNAVSVNVAHWIGKQLMAVL
jgi:DNA (cytosine-5)-methyltransferase 1